MKKILTVLAILLALSLVALFIFQIFLTPDSGESTPTGTQEATLPGASGTEATEGSQMPVYTFPEEAETQPTGTTAPETTPEESTIPTAEPGLDENETPKMEF